MGIYDFKAQDIDGAEVSLSQYQGKVLLIVNTASKCGFTSQYEGLQALYEKYQAQGLEILGFPSNQFAEQEPGTNEDVKQFCLINFGVSFPLFEKTDVRGPAAHPLFVYLTERLPFKGFGSGHPMVEKMAGFLRDKFPEILPGNSVKWNFTKFLIDAQGNPVSRHEPWKKPEELEDEIVELIGRSK